MSAELEEAPTRADTLAEALLAAQLEMPAVEPDKTNPHFGSKFVSLGYLLAKVRPVLNKHGIAVVQMPSQDEEGRPVLVTRLQHLSGEAMESTSPLLMTKNDPQAFGSALTYAKRYALSAVLAIADQEDDDGNAGSAEAQVGVKSSPQKTSRPSDKQLGFLESLAKDRGFLDTELSLLMEWAGQNLTGGKEGSCSAAINGLKDRDQAKRTETADRIGRAAKEWAAKQSDVPGVAEGLEVENHPEDEEIPF